MPLPAVALQAPASAAGGGAWTPASLPNLENWYDASDTATITATGSTVNAWADKSGKGRALAPAGGGGLEPATGTRTINGLNTLDFDGSNDRVFTSTFGTAFGPTTAWTWAAVFLPDTVGVSGRVSSMWGAADDYNAPDAFEHDVVNSGTYWNNVQVTQAALYSTTVPTLTVVTRNGGTWTQTVNGAAATGSTGQSTTSTGWSKMGIGARTTGADGYFDGRIGEVIVCSSAISGTDLTSLTSYLTTKWGISATWTPASLPNLVGWYDASDTASISSSAGAVSQWNDKSGSSNHLTQANGSYKPTTGATENGLNAITFASASFLSNAISASPGSAGRTVISVHKPTQTTSDLEYWYPTNALSNACQIQLRGSSGGAGKFAIILAGVSVTVLSTTGDTAARTQRTFETKGGGVSFAHNIRVNGVADGSATASTSYSNAGNWSLGGALGSGGGFTGNICEEIVCDTILSSTDRALAESYLRTKWGTPFDPRTISGLVGWYDASDASSITASSGAVSQWSDKSGAANHATQTVGGNKPVTGSATIGGVNAIAFSAASTQHLLAAGLPAKSSSMSTFIVANVTSTSSARTLIGSEAASQRQILTSSGTGPMNLNYENNTFVVGSNTNMPTGAAHVWGLTRVDGGSYAWYYDGAADGSGTSGLTMSGTDTGSHIGAGYLGGGTSPMEGSIGEIIQYSSILSSTEAATVCAYLKAKWGTP